MGDGVGTDGAEAGSGEQATGGGRGLSRRHFLLGLGGLATLGVGGVAGYEWPHGTSRPVARLGGRAAAAPLARTAAAGSALPSEVVAFVSRPDLRPPLVRVAHSHARLSPAGTRLAAPASPEYIFLAVKGYRGPVPSQAGLLVVDRRGQVVWFKPVSPAEPFDFNVQSYRGERVLTWWQGTVDKGVGYGQGKLADSSYGLVRTIGGHDGLVPDLHELNLTSSGTALVTAYHTVDADLSRYGGHSRAPVLASHALEIDLATGKVLMNWDSLEHVGFGESYAPAPKAKGAPWDYFHINSIAEMPNGNLLISARNTWALYEVERTTGKVLWRVNGKKSDFTMASDAHFYWQHHARPHPGNRLTVFDDGGTPAEERQSRGLLLNLDTKARHVSLEHAYLHPAGFLAANQGSVQLLADGRVFIGWGNQPYFSEFSADGTMLLDGELPPNVQSYRAFTHDWAGHPIEPPAVVARTNPAGGATVFASWNGATALDSWKVLAGASATSLQPVGSQERTAFETAVAVNSEGPYFRAVALDAHGRELGRSPVVKLTGATPKGA